MALVKRIRHGEDKPAEVNVTSLIDITFLLIVFFISIWQVAHMELAAELTLPLASQGNPELQQDKDRLIVNLDKDGDIYIARTRLTREELGKILSREAARSREPDGFARRPVFIRADADLAFGAVRDVMLICRKAHIWRLSLRISKPKETEG